MRWKGEKAKCWEEVRRIVRERDGDKCYTCPRREVKYDTGHYLPVAIVGSNNVCSWDLRFIRRQCSRCNGAGQGEQAIFRENLVRELGESTVSDFERLARRINPIKNWKVLLEELKRL